MVTHGLAELTDGRQYLLWALMVQSSGKFSLDFRAGSDSSPSSFNEQPAQQNRSTSLGAKWDNLSTLQKFTTSLGAAFGQRCTKATCTGLSSWSWVAKRLLHWTCIHLALAGLVGNGHKLLVGHGHLVRSHHCFTATVLGCVSMDTGPWRHHDQ